MFGKASLLALPFKVTVISILLEVALGVITCSNCVISLGASGLLSLEPVNDALAISVYCITCKTLPPAPAVTHSGAVAPEFIASFCEAVPLANLCNPLPSL